MLRALIPVAPAVVGLILGPLAEKQLRRALTLSEDPPILLSSPVTIVLWAVVAIAPVASIALPLFRRRRAKAEGPSAV